MSEDKGSHDEVRINPSIESLRLAIEAGKGQTWTAEYMVCSAALFEAYRSGLIRFSIHDGNGLGNGFHNLLLGRIEGSYSGRRDGGRINVDQCTGFSSLSHGDSLGDVPDQVLSGHSTHDSTPIADEQHPADSHSAGRMGSVSRDAYDQSGCAMHDGRAGQEERRDCDGFPSPTDDELRKHGCPALVEPRARTFLCQLPDSDLAAINASVIPTPLMKLIGRVAYDELERRRDA